jgi:lipoprotein-anchoring transpeptidase ErfK/SrfK
MDRHHLPRWMTALLCGAVIAGCGSTAAAPPRSSPPPPPQVSVSPADGSKGLAPDSAVTVTVSGGRLDTVKVHSSTDTTVLPGTLAGDGSSWKLTGGLMPSTTYVVEASASGPGGRTSDVVHLATIAGQRLITSPFPADGSTVGVGMPIELKFNTGVPSALQANLLSHIQVTSTPAVKGDWHWWSDDTVHWRPENLWPAGTKVNISANLLGINAGNGFWGFGNWSESFTIGEKHVSIIDNNTHQMQVFKSDALQVTYPVSMGVDDRWPTISGTMFVPFKLQDLLMDSLGLSPPIPHNAPGGYLEHVYWDTAISTDGFYIHSAPWSVGAQGNSNVSHGCVNLSEARAIEFYNFSQIGDVVIIKNTPRAADQGDGEGDWQIPFAQYPNSGGTITAPAGHGAAGGL